MGINIFKIKFLSFTICLLFLSGCYTTFSPPADYNNQHDSETFSDSEDNYEEENYTIINNYNCGHNTCCNHSNCHNHDYYFGYHGCSGHCSVTLNWWSHYHYYDPYHHHHHYGHNEYNWYYNYYYGDNFKYKEVYCNRVKIMN